MIIAVDFDGTIAADTHDPETIGGEIHGAIEALKSLRRAGHLLVLFTLRDQPCGGNDRITSALAKRLDWLMDRGISFMALPRQIQYSGWKFPFDYLIDDKSNFPPSAPDWPDIAKKLGKAEQ